MEKSGFIDITFGITVNALPASVAQLDARPTGDQEVTPAEVGNILSWRLYLVVLFGVTLQLIKLKTVAVSFSGPV